MNSIFLHATTVSCEGQGVMILGPSGSGKSALALELIALGAQLVSDDQTVVTVANAEVSASAPPAIAGMIEARGIGLLHVAPAGPTPLALVVDMGRDEPDRLPAKHTHDVHGITLPCLWRVPARHFAPAILLYLQGGIGDAA